LYSKGINSKISSNSLLISNLDDHISVTNKNGSTIYKLGEVLIETGTIEFPVKTYISQVKLTAEFENAPTIIATGEFDNQFDYGYPLVGDFTTTGFTCSLLDKVVNNNKVLAKKGGRVLYVAIGKVKSTIG